MLRSMKQFSTGERGALTIGITPFRSAYLIPDIVKKVREKFPGVCVKLIEEGSELLRKDAADGRFDFAVVNMPVDESLLEATPIEPDKLVLVYSSELENIPPELKEQTEVDFRCCGKIPFVVLGAGQEMRLLFDNLCTSLEVYPQIAAEVVNMTTAREMACSGVAATLLPLQFVNSAAADRKLVVRKLVNSVQLRQPAIVTRKGQYISPYAGYAMELLTGGR